MNNEILKNDERISNKILNDINDGVIVISFDGEILYINEATEKIIGIDKDLEGKKYVELMINLNEENDEFHQMLLKAVENKKLTNKDKIYFVKKDGKKICLEIRASYYQEKGVIITFTDITEVDKLERKVYDSAVSFIVLLAGMCVWIFLYGLYEHFNRPFEINTMTNILLLLSAAMFLFYLKFTSLELKDVGLSTDNLVRNLFVGVIITILGFVFLVIVKLIMMKNTPMQFYNKPFFNFNEIKKYLFTYLISAVWQEFIIRGVVHKV